MKNLIISIVKFNILNSNEKSCVSVQFFSEGGLRLKVLTFEKKECKFVVGNIPIITMKRRFLILSLIAFCCVAARAELKYIFYFIGDGMGMGQVMATEAYNRTVLKNNDRLLMTRFPTVSVATTHSASSPITDSAAAGTALATGFKTKNGMLGMSPDTLAVTSIAKTLFDDGYGIGIVTSVAPDDATPGAFYAHVPSRKMYYEVGCQAAESGYDFIAGAGLRGLVDKHGKATDLLERFTENEVTIVRGMDGLETVDTRRVLLLSSDTLRVNNIGYTIDSLPGALTLPAMTRACLDHLEKNGRQRFFMMVEGGNIDHAGHANDGGTVVKEVLNFQEAIKIAYDFYLAHPDETLIVITADHETGGLSPGNTDMGYNLRLDYLDYQKVSKDEFSDYCKNLLRTRRIYTWDDMKEYLTENFGFWEHVPVTEAQTEELKADFEKCFIDHRGADQKTLYNDFNEFAVNVFRVLDSATGLGWTTVKHSAGLVPVYAIGVGADRFASFNDNVDIPQTILEIAESKR